jgi:hypothetical protein
MKNTLVTSDVGQIQAIIDVVGIAAMNAVKIQCEKKTTAERQRILAQGDKLTFDLTEHLITKLTEFAEQKIGYLKLISGGEEIIISETDGEDIITYAKNTFPGFSDPDFANCRDTKDQPTKEIKVRVFEQIRDGTPAQIFGGFGENLDRLCLTRGQIIRFVEDNSKWFGMRDCFTTSFLFKKNGKHSVARVYNGGGMLKVFADSLSGDRFCVAKDHYRFVVPQL